MPGFSLPDFTGHEPLITRACPHPSHQMILKFMKISLTIIPQPGSHAGTGALQLLPCCRPSQCCAPASSTTAPRTKHAGIQELCQAFRVGRWHCRGRTQGCVLLHAYTFTAPAQLVTVLWGWNGCHGQTGEVAAPRASLAPTVPPALGNQHTTLTRGLGRASPSSF